MGWYQCEVGIDICLGSFVGRVVTSVLLTKKLWCEVVHGWGSTSVPLGHIGYMRLRRLCGFSGMSTKMSQLNPWLLEALMMRWLLMNRISSCGRDWA